MITATSTDKSVSQGKANWRPKWDWRPECATQVGLAPLVRDWSQSDTPSARLKSVWHPQCATQACQIRATFGLDSLFRAGSGRAPHPGNFQKWVFFWSSLVLNWESEVDLKIFTRVTEHTTFFDFVQGQIWFSVIILGHIWELGFHTGFIYDFFGFVLGSYQEIEYGQY